MVAVVCCVRSLHLTSLCLQHTPTIVACVCIHLACKWSSFEVLITRVFGHIPEIALLANCLCLFSTFDIFLAKLLKKYGVICCSVHISRPVRIQVTALVKLLTRMCLSNQTV